MSDSISRDENRLVVIEKETPLADSRIVAQELGIDHRSFFQMIRQYQEEVEADFGQVRFQIALGSRAQGGGNPLRYALLTEDQSYVFLAYSKNTAQARACKRLLVKAFKEAREKLAKQQQEAPHPLLNSLFVDRLRLFSRHTKIPRDRWCVFQEICQPFLEFELRGYQLPDKAVPDGSVGRRWCDYARDVLGYDMSLVESYPHVYPDKRGKQPAYIYPLEWLPAFRLWFYTVYLPENFPQYLRYLKASMSEIDLVLKGFGLPPQLKPGK